MGVAETTRPIPTAGAIASRMRGRFQNGTGPGF